MDYNNRAKARMLLRQKMLGPKIQNKTCPEVGQNTAERTYFWHERDRMSQVYRKKGSAVKRYTTQYVGRAAFQKRARNDLV